MAMTRMETRTREITVDGKAVTQAYTVNVPYTETREFTYQVAVLQGEDKADIPVEKIRAWDLTGRVVDTATLAVKLVFPTHVMVIELDPNETYEALDPYYASVMKQDTLVLCIEPQPPEVEAEQDAIEAPAVDAPMPPAPAAPPDPAN